MFKLIKRIKEAIGLSELEVKVKKLNKSANIPKYAHDGDVGMDIVTIWMEYDDKEDMYIYGTGLSLETDKHYGVLLFPRSSNMRTEAYLCNHVGVVDSALYRGEIKFMFKNRDSLQSIINNKKLEIIENEMIENGGILTADSMKKLSQAEKKIRNNPELYAPYKVGERIGQMVVIPYPNVKITEKNELSETVRGEGGFGSTGK